ncbi:MAG: PAS domain S-box protein [Promethearchaeota archaeon]
MSKLKNDLRRPEMGYFNLINSILDVIIELDLDLTITYINDQVYDVYGYSTEEIIGKKCIEFIHPDDVPKTLDAIKKGIKTKLVISIEIRLRHKSGTYIPTFTKGQLVENHNQSKIVAVLRDITEIKETEHKLMESDQRYRKIIESIEDGYFEVDIKGNYTYVNDYISKFMGIPKNKLLGNNFAHFVDKDTVKEVFKIFNQVYNHNLPKGTFESQVIRNDGEKRTFEGWFYLKYDSNGKKVGFYGFTRDITSRKEAENKLKESEEKYREAYGRAELYKDLFYHDINNILTNIKLSIDISEKYIDEIGKEKDIKDLYSLIREQFGRGTKLISNVRKLSNLESLEHSLKSFEVTKSLKNTIRFINKSFQTKNLNININTTEKKLFVTANELITEVFDNLLINAINYNENPTKDILIKLSREIKNDINYIKFEFIDNGIGILDEKKKLIFQERFSKDRGSKGLGFGLTLVKKIIDHYKGEIWIENRVAEDYTQGSNFIFLIPEANK